MQLPRSDPQRAGVIEKRTLQNIQDDYEQFVADGPCSSRQKFYRNAIHEKLLDIELDKVKICFWVHTYIQDIFLLAFLLFKHNIFS